MNRLLKQKPKVITKEDLKTELHNTMLPTDLTNLLLKYTETSAKVEFEDGDIEYYSQSEFNDLDCKDVVNITIYGVMVLIDPTNKFNESKIQTITGDVVLIGDASFMFSTTEFFDCDINHWDTSQVTDMSSMFYHAQNFNGLISSWGVSNVTNMESMFEGSGFDQKIGDWNVSNVMNMSSMFRNSVFNSDISGWDVSNVTDMYEMFWGAEYFDKNISKWNTSNVTNILDMFYEADEFDGKVVKKTIWKITYNE